MASNAQLFAPGRDKALLTKYATVGAVQDSIFVVFSSSSNPKKGTLKAKFSDGSISDFTWYKYNSTITIPVNRFVQYSTETDVVESTITNLEKGGYRVVVNRKSDNVKQTYTCWLLIDDVVITSIDIDNNCDYLYLNTKLNPNRYTIPDYFKYWDLSKTNHPVNISIGNSYFDRVTWHSTNSQVPMAYTTLSVTLDPAPPYESKYDIKLVNPFGRELTFETPVQPAKAVKADFSVFTDLEGTWKDGGTEPKGEAPLKLKFESKSINADSIYWQIINDSKLFKQYGDSIVWRDSALFTARIDAYPTPEKMVPGTYPIKHIAVKEISGCRDTMTVAVVIYSSNIPSTAIPNVFYSCW